MKEKWFQRVLKSALVATMFFAIPSMSTQAYGDGNYYYYYENQSKSNMAHNIHFYDQSDYDNDYEVSVTISESEIALLSEQEVNRIAAFKWMIYQGDKKIAEFSKDVEDAVVEAKAGITLLNEKVEMIPGESYQLYCGAYAYKGSDLVPLAELTPVYFIVPTSKYSQIGVCGPNAVYCLHWDTFTADIVGEGYIDYEDHPVFYNYESRKNLRVGCSDAKHIIIHEGITEIKEKTFMNMLYVEDYQLPKSLKIIGDSAFAESKKLKEITFPENVEIIGDKVLYSPEVLEKVVFPDSVKILGKHSIGFGSCLKYVKLPKYLDYIPESTFTWCSDAEIVYPEKVKTIKRAAFYGAGMETYIVPDTVETIEDSAFMYCKKLKNLVLPEGIKNIPESMCRKCFAMETMVFPEGVETIGRGVFEECSSLKTVYIPASVKSIDGYLFLNCPSDITILYGGTKDQWDDIELDRNAINTGKVIIEYEAKEPHMKHNYTKYISLGNGKHNLVCEECHEIQPDYVSEDCLGGKATCTAKAVCTKCGNEYGELQAHSYATTWTQNAKNHWKVCTVCKTTGNAGAHSDANQDEKCDGCGYNMHRHAGSKVAQVNSTCSAFGVKAYYKCSCGKLYEDEALTKEIADLAAWKNGAGRIAKKAHSIVTTVTKATMKTDGKIQSECQVCSIVTNTTPIYAASNIKLSQTKYTYDGKSKKPAVTVLNSKGAPIANTNYTVTYSKGRKTVGKYQVIVTLKGNYAGTKKLQFTVIPQPTKISLVTGKSKSIAIKWSKKTKQVTGYEVMYSTSSGFKSGNKTVIIKNNKTTSKTIKNLKNKKKYYVKVRTYKTVNGVNYYSAWSEKKMVKTK